MKNHSGFFHLKSQRPMKHQTQPSPETIGHYSTLRISSTAFKEGEFIPSKYTCDGLNVNPPLYIHAVPEKAKSLVLIVDDPDCPGGTWIHWLVWNIPPGSSIAENEIPGEEGTNDFKKSHFGGPCPPSGVHRYIISRYMHWIACWVRPPVQESARWRERWKVMFWPLVSSWADIKGRRPNNSNCFVFLLTFGLICQKIFKS